MVEHSQVEASASSSSTEMTIRDIHPIAETLYSIPSIPLGPTGSSSSDHGSIDGEVSGSPTPSLPQLPQGWTPYIPNGWGLKWKGLVVVLFAVLFAILIITPTITLLKVFVFKHKKEFKCDINLRVSQYPKDTTYKTISSALEASPSYSSRSICILIQEGEYVESVKISHDKTNVVLKGLGNIIITLNASTNFPGATLWVLGKGFVARDLTVKNTAKDGVAVSNWGDDSVFFRTKLEGVGGSLHLNGIKQFYHSTKIYGKNRTISGHAYAYFKKCEIYVNKVSTPREKLIIIDDPQDNIPSTAGLTFHPCRFGCTGVAADSKSTTFISSAVAKRTDLVVLQSYLDENIAGYIDNQLNTTGDVDVFGNTGPGSRIVQPFIHELHTVSDASKYSLRAFLSGEDWIPSYVGLDLDIVQ